MRASAHLHRWSRRHVGILLAVAAILCAGMYVSRVGATNSLPTPGLLLRLERPKARWRLRNLNARLVRA